MHHKAMIQLSEQPIPMCSNCGVKPVLIKKRGLCSGCYQRYRKGMAVTSSPLINKNPRHDREKWFVEKFFDHDKWEYEPIAFLLPDGTRFTPDFYDMGRNVFIEVAGTRQAYEYNRGKYNQFYKTYPNIPFEIRLPNGELLKHSPTGRGIKWNDELPYKSLKKLERLNPYQLPDQTKGEAHYFHKLNTKQVREIRNSDKTIKEIAEEYGIHWQQAFRIKNRLSWSWLR